METYLLLFSKNVGLEVISILSKTDTTKGVFRNVFCKVPIFKFRKIFREVTVIVFIQEVLTLLKMTYF